MKARHPVVRAHLLAPSMTVPKEGAPCVIAAFERAPDRRTLTVGLAGGPGTYGWLKWFEDEMPQDLYRWLPSWFTLQLETGRCDELGFYGEVDWRRVYSKEDAAKLEGYPVFQKP